MKQTHTGEPRPETVEELALRLADNWLRAQYRNDGPWTGRDRGTTQGLAALIAKELHGWAREVQNVHQVESRKSKIQRIIDIALRAQPK